MAEKGQWVSIRRRILDVGERAAGIPQDTAAVPFEMWVKGTLLEDAEMGAETSVCTVTGRTEHGILEEVEPGYSVGYGGLVPQLLGIGPQARGLLFGGGQNE